MINMLKNTSNPISLEKFKQIKQKYGSMASWAFWKELIPGEKAKSGMGDISFFDNPTDNFLKMLNPNIILVGLNISRKIVRPFGNFHPDYPQAQDYKLRYALRHTPLWGAYMTDIIKDFEQKVSGKLMSYLRAHHDFEEENIQFFKEELKDIGAVNPILIALGNDAENILNYYLKGKNGFRIFKVTHYSHYNNNKEKLRDAFRDIIPKIDQDEKSKYLNSL